MDNVTMRVEGKKLIIEVDASVPGEPSTSGKTLVVASTRGAQEVMAMGRRLSIGLNVYTKDRQVTPKAA